MEQTLRNEPNFAERSDGEHGRRGWKEPPEGARVRNEANFEEARESLETTDWLRLCKLRQFRLPAGRAWRYAGGMAQVRAQNDRDDASPDALQVQCEIYRQMPARRKLELVFDAYQTGRLLAMAGIRMRNPGATAEDLWQIWARGHLGEELFESVYGGDSRE